MKKITSIITIIALLTTLIFTGNTYAASLDSIDIQTSKTTVRPGEEVTISINFGEELGAYTVEAAYDDAIFDYVSVEGGEGNDTGDKVIVTFHDTTGGTNPRTTTSITFKAKADITTSNPTEFTITATGLANADASVEYDDITTPIVKNVTVEPEYVDYTIKLEHTGDIIKEKETAMTLSYSSPMGKYYEHARLIAEATTPEGATVKLLATDQARLEHDIIQSGWGDAQGFKIGGKDVSQVLNVTGIFSEVGDYTITLKLIDRDNSDSVIATGAFNLKAVETPATPPTTPETPPTTNPETPPATTPEENPGQTPETTTPEEVIPEETPKVLPKTGNNIYVPAILILVSLISYSIYYNKRK